jgi:hypothetical protein
LKIKLDENIGRRGIEILANAGHEVMTVRDQGLAAAADDILFDVCAGEGRVLITLDRDFGETLRFPPWKGAGIAVLDPGRRATIKAIRTCLAAAKLHSIHGALWIVEPHRLRIHLRDTP